MAFQKRIGIELHLHQLWFNLRKEKKMDKVSLLEETKEDIHVPGK